MKPLITEARLRYCAATIAVVSLALVALGGYVRGTGAGLACPDWPLCYGRMVPPELRPGVMQEVLHRYTASVVSTLSAAFALLCFINRKRYPRLWTAAKFFLCILVAQVILGGLTVLLRLNPFIVTGHLAAGTIFFQLMAQIALSRTPTRREEDVHLQKFQRPSNHRPRRLSNSILALSLCVYCQMLLGGFIGSSGAALACQDIPFCGGKLIPDGATAPQYLQMFHRIFGVAIFLASLGIAVFCRSLSDGIIKKRGHLFGVSFMIMLQIALGLSNVYFQIPVTGAVTHLILAQMILLGSLRFYFRINPHQSFFYCEEKLRGNDEGLGEYTPTKRNFVANF